MFSIPSILRTSILCGFSVTKAQVDRTWQTPMLQSIVKRLQRFAPNNVLNVMDKCIPGYGRVVCSGAGGCYTEYIHRKCAGVILRDGDGDSSIVSSRFFEQKRISENFPEIEFTE